MKSQRHRTRAAAKSRSPGTVAKERLADALQGAVADLLAGVPCPPTDLDLISGRLEITRIWYQHDLPHSGELRQGGGGFEIVCSPHLGQARRRFTIAHELAHALFEANPRLAPRDNRRLERACDEVATELLMPAEIFARSLGDRTSFEDLGRLARTFEVSLSAAAIRCSEMGNLAVFEVVHNRVSWSRGIILPKNIAAFEPELRDAVRRCVEGERITSRLLMGSGPCHRYRVEGMPYRANGVALLLLQAETSGLATR